MILLDGTLKKLVLLTGAAVSTDWTTCYTDISTSTFTPTSSDGNVATATSTDIVAAPSGSNKRKVQYISVRNRSTTASQTVTIQLNNNGTVRYMGPDIVLQPGEVLEYTDTDGFYVLADDGSRKSRAGANKASNTVTRKFYKVGTASEAAGVGYCYSKDSGIPGAWAVGTPGLAGRATDGTNSADAGCIPYVNAASGANYLAFANIASTVLQSFDVMDVLWVNSGIVVTTTTAQTINSVAWPARDLNGSTNGAGVMVGLLVTTATTNGSAITNCTMSYTNESGTSGRTATMASFPATAVVGSVVWFRLDAGDSGVRSIQSITLGTSMVTGAVSLIAAVSLTPIPATVANIQAPSPITGDGVRLYDGTCMLLFQWAAATTATTISGSIGVTNK